MPALRFTLLVSFTLTASQLWAAITPLAITGDNVASLPSAVLATFGNAKLNTAGQAVFGATLQTGVGDVTSANEKVLLAFDAGLNVLAQSGSGNVAGATGTDYANFLEFAIDNSGHILLKATLVETGGVTVDNRQGYWRFDNGSPSLITRSGTTTAPGTTSTKFFDVGARVGTSHTGDFAFLGQLSYGNGVNGGNDLGLWRYQGSTGTLVVRENTAVTDMPGALYASFGHPVINSTNQIAARTTMKVAGSITNANRAGIWSFASGVGTMLARTGSGNVPGDPGDFTVFSDPTINDSGQIAFRATLASGKEGLWLYTGTAGTNLAFSNAGNVPDVPTASFAFFSKPALTESGRLLVAAGLATGVGGVTTSDDSGLWLFDDTLGSKLLVREGVGGVSGIPGASFASFPHFAPVGDTGVYVDATLQNSAGIVDTSNDRGIWHIPFAGTPELIVRKGDTLAGRTIADLWLPAGEFDDTPLMGISNASGELLFHASFTNGDSGLLLYSPGTTIEYAAADFNLDGFVDHADLVMWQGAYDTTTAGDADNDGDTDGADLLVWQRQHTSPAPAVAALAVPEPGVSWLLIAAAFCGFGTRRGNRAQRC